MSRWGSQMPQKGKEHIYGHDTPKRNNYLNGNRVSFLTGEPVADNHHEPPICVVLPLGYRDSEEPLPVSHAVHAKFHKERHALFGDTRDRDAYFAQASMMNEEESDMFEIIDTSEEKTMVIRNEIIRRAKRYGLG